MTRDDETTDEVTIEDVTDDKSFVVNNDDFKEPEEIDAETAIVDQQTLDQEPT